MIYAEGVPAETLINVQEFAVNFADYLRRYGTAATDEEHCAPHIHIWGGRVELASRFAALSRLGLTSEIRLTWFATA